jgi:hypothetical protein
MSWLAEHWTVIFWVALFGFALWFLTSKRRWGG